MGDTAGAAAHLVLELGRTAARALR